MMRLDTVVAGPAEEENVGAGVPDLPKPELTGGLNAPHAFSDTQHKLKNFDDDERACRICLEEEESLKDPLITPCTCIGSIRWIHIDCLKSWLKLKR